VAFGERRLTFDRFLGGSPAIMIFHGCLVHDDRRKGPPTFPGCQKVGGPWYVVSLREFLLLTAPSGLLCGNWDFSSPFSGRCSHGYQVQVKNSSIASLSHHRQAFRIAPPAGSEGRPRALRYRGRG